MSLELPDDQACSSERVAPDKNGNSGDYRSCGLYNGSGASRPEGFLADMADQLPSGTGLII